MSEDAVRVFFDHLLLLPTRPVEKLDVFLCSNGGSAAVPWRFVSLFREYAKSFNVLIPYRAYSAATLLALGADEIVMHPFAEMGPIDPTVSNEFNPVESGTGRRLGISVEDVKAYLTFIKATVGITHEDELVQTIRILAEKVHPLALGNVERFISQTRMMAGKILRTHMRDNDQHIIDEIIENLASKLYFHGHAINREEARRELKLKVITELPAGLETAMWELYKDYEAELDTRLWPF
jgi:membrane-bound ClpP family serine protease